MPRLPTRAFSSSRPKLAHQARRRTWCDCGSPCPRSGSLAVPVSLFAPNDGSRQSSPGPNGCVGGSKLAKGRSPVRRQPQGSTQRLQGGARAPTAPGASAYPVRRHGEPSLTKRLVCVAPKVVSGDRSRSQSSKSPRVLGPRKTRALSAPCCMPLSEYLKRAAPPAGLLVAIRRGGCLLVGSGPTGIIRFTRDFVACPNPRAVPRNPQRAPVYSRCGARA
jgi:hypothetical protein